MDISIYIYMIYIYPSFFIKIALCLVEYFDMYNLYENNTGLCNMKQREHRQAVILELRRVNKERHYTINKPNDTKRTLTSSA